MTDLYEIKNLCKKLKIAGEHEIADKLLLAYAALGDTESPRVDLSYSYVMRELRKKDKGNVRKFQTVFRDSFYEALDQGLEDAEEIALMSALKAIDWNDDN